MKGPQHGARTLYDSAIHNMQCRMPRTYVHVYIVSSRIMM